METRIVRSDRGEDGIYRWAFSVGLLLLTVLLGCDGPSGGGVEGTSGAGSDAEIVSLFGTRLPPDATLREVLQHPDVLERTQRVAQILQRSGPEQLDTLLAGFEGASLDRGDLEYVLFANWWARFDPQAAFVYSDDHLRMEHPRVILEVVRVWGRTDPLGAVQSGSLSNLDLRMPALRGELVDSLVVGWFESGQPGLEDFIQGLKSSEETTSAIATYARMRVLRDGAEETIAWTFDAPFSPEFRRLLLAGAISITAHQDPQVAIAWLDKAKEQGVDTRTFIPRIARSWAHHQPREAMEWVRAQTEIEGPEQKRAIMDIAKKWWKRDEADLARWLETNIGEEWTDLMRFQAVTFHIRHNDYRVDWSRMMQRAEALVSENSRQTLYQWVLQRWLVAEPEGAEAWIAAHPDALSEDQLARAHQISPRERAEIEAAVSPRSTS